MSIDVNAVKDQFARFLEAGDSGAFKDMAEYYLRTAATLKRKDIDAPTRERLWIRNSVKRLFLGIGCELLLKAFYLRKGCCLNLPNRGSGLPSVPTHRLAQIKRDACNHRDTYRFGALVDNLKQVQVFENHEQIERAFRIAIVFRNKEGHTTFIAHHFDPANYTDVEGGLVHFYNGI